MGLRQAGENKAKRLAIIAGQLDPHRFPWWVSEPGGLTPSQGWWWIPNGATLPEFLGHNAIVAEVNLRELVDSGLKPL